MSPGVKTRSPTAEPVMMMRPPLFMYFSASCVAASVPRTLMSITRSISSERGLLERFRDGCAGVVHEHIESPERREGLFDRALDGSDVGSVCSDRDRLSTIELNRFDHGGSRACVFCVRNGHARSIGCQTLRDGCTDPPGTAGNERHFIG